MGGGPSRNNGRLFAIYLDEHISPGVGVVRARAALSKFINEQLGPDDLIVVMKPLESLFDIHLTHDRATAAHIVEGLDGRRGEYTARNDYEKNFMAGDPSRIDAARDQVVLSALNALAVNLGETDDGRKNIIIVTEGIGRPPRNRGQEYLATLEGAIRAATRSLTTVYVVDPRVEAPDDAAAAERQAMQTIARQTSAGDRRRRSRRRAAGRRARSEAPDHVSLGPSRGRRFHPVRPRQPAGLKAERRAWAPSTRTSFERSCWSGRRSRVEAA